MPQRLLRTLRRATHAHGQDVVKSSLQQRAHHATVHTKTSPQTQHGLTSECNSSNTALIFVFELIGTHIYIWLIDGIDRKNLPQVNKLFKCIQ